MKSLKNVKSIIACGDIHGEFKTLKYLIKNKQIENSAILLCGDIGMGFYKRAYYENIFTYLNEYCTKTNNVIIGVRGNHDDPIYFDGTFEYSNIKLVKDYTMLEIANKNVLFIGGATSVDRKMRVLGVSYWNDEAAYYDEDKLKAHKKPDIIITHTAPNFCQPIEKWQIKHFLMLDKDLEKDCDKERKTFTKIFDFLSENDRSPAFWCYGHFHNSYTEIVNTTTFKMLDIDEFFQIH